MYKYKFLFLLALLTVTSGSFLFAQFVPKYEHSKKLRDTILMNTNHFYLGGEIGLGFNLGPTVTIQGGPRMETNVAPFGRYDFSMFTPTKFYAGYVYKNHHFEGAVGMVREKINVSILDSLGNRAVDYNRSNLYATLTVRYFYRLPIRVPRLKFMIGAELGGGYHPPFLPSQPHFTFTDTNYTMNTSMLKSHDMQLIMGLNARLDIKVFKNLTFTLHASMIGSPMKGTEYALNYTTPGSTNYVAQVHGSILNVNLNAGLKFDFFTHKSKKATYEKYKITDPFRDDQ
jgi:hypothetical protein